MEKLIIGISGVFLGSILTLLREYINEHRSREREARYLAVRVTCMLERLISDCHHVAWDYGLPDQDGYHQAKTNLPNLNFDSLDGNWQSLPFELMYELLDFPSDIESAKEFIDATYEHATEPDYPEVFEERQYQFSKIGLKAHELSKSLRYRFSMPAREYGEWGPIESLKKTVATIEDRREKARSLIPSEPLN